MFPDSACFQKVNTKKRYPEYLNILFSPLLCHRPNSKRVRKRLDVELFIEMTESREAVSIKTDLKKITKQLGD